MGAENWAEYPLRWAQLTLVENDPGTFDPDFWLSYFERVRAQGACLSAGGYVCYYPTEIPLHHRSAWMGDTDLFGTLAEGCRKRGMVVLARTDPHAVHQDVFDAHPDWVATDPDGSLAAPLVDARGVGHMRPGPLQLRIHDGGTSRDRASLRRAGYLQQPVGRSWYLLLRTPAAGTSHDATGYDVPLRQDPEDPAWRAYSRWRHDRLLDVARLWDDVISGRDVVRGTSLIREAAR